MNAAQIDALVQAQTGAAAVVDDVRRRLRFGMRLQEVRFLVNRLAGDHHLSFLSPPRLWIGERAAGTRRLPVGKEPEIEGDTLVTLDLRVRNGAVAGDYARTLRFGESGRHWYFEGIAKDVYRMIIDHLSSCRKLSDYVALCEQSARAKGCRIANEHGISAHPIRLLPEHPLALALEMRRDALTLRARRMIPGGLASPALTGVWALEPIIEVDRHRFMFEDLFLFEGGAVRCLGPEPLPD